MTVVFTHGDGTLGITLSAVGTAESVHFATAAQSAVSYASPLRARATKLYAVLAASDEQTHPFVFCRQPESVPVVTLVMRTPEFPLVRLENAPTGATVMLPAVTAVMLAPLGVSIAV
jgi:hypothetical protein